MESKEFEKRNLCFEIISFYDFLAPVGHHSFIPIYFAFSYRVQRSLVHIFQITVVDQIIILLPIISI
jgi:hypothetical protein